MTTTLSTAITANLPTIDNIVQLEQSLWVINAFTSWALTNWKSHQGDLITAGTYEDNTAFWQIFNLFLGAYEAWKTDTSNSLSFTGTYTTLAPYLTENSVLGFATGADFKTYLNNLAKDIQDHTNTSLVTELTDITGISGTDATLLTAYTSFCKAKNAGSILDINSDLTSANFPNYIPTTNTDSTTEVYCTTAFANLFAEINGLTTV